MIKKAAAVHIPESEAARDLPALLAKVRDDAQTVIVNGALPAAILRPEFPARRTVSERTELARRHEQESGEIPVLDADFADDIAEIIRYRKPWMPPA